MDDLDAAVICVAGNASYAVPLARVSAVERPGRLTALPFAAPWVVGVTQAGGAVVTVLDVASFVEGRRTAVTPQTRLVIARGTGRPLGLLVDAVERITPTGQVTSEHEDDAPSATGTLPAPLKPLNVDHLMAAAGLAG